MGLVEMRTEVAPVPTDDRPRDGLEQGARYFANQIAPQEVRAAGSVFPRPPGAVIEKGGELRVYLIQIAGWVLVQDDDISAQPFQPPVLLCLQHLTHERDIGIANHAHEQD